MALNGLILPAGFGEGEKIIIGEILDFAEKLKILLSQSIEKNGEAFKLEFSVSSSTVTVTVVGGDPVRAVRGELQPARIGQISAANVPPRALIAKTEYRYPYCGKRGLRAILDAYPGEWPTTESFQEIDRAIFRISVKSKKSLKDSFLYLFDKTQQFAKSRNGNTEFLWSARKWYKEERYEDDPKTWINRIGAKGKPLASAPDYQSFKR